MTDGEKVIGRGFIKGCGSADRVFRIKSENSYVITFMNVEGEYRGKRLQQLIAGELVDRFVKNRHDCRVFAYVYYYNIPSLRNLSNFGFRAYKNKSVIRLAKHTLNKETI